MDYLIIVLLTNIFNWVWSFSLYPPAPCKFFLVKYRYFFLRPEAARPQAYANTPISIINCDFCKI